MNYSFSQVRTIKLLIHISMTRHFNYTFWYNMGLNTESNSFQAHGKKSPLPISSTLASLLPQTLTAPSSTSTSTSRTNASGSLPPGSRPPPGGPPGNGTASGNGDLSNPASTMANVSIVSKCQVFNRIAIGSHLQLLHINLFTSFSYSFTTTCKRQLRLVWEIRKKEKNAPYVEKLCMIGQHGIVTCVFIPVRNILYYTFLDILYMCVMTLTVTHLYFLFVKKFAHLPV